MIKLVEVLTEEKQIYTLVLGKLRIYVCWCEEGEGEMGTKGSFTVTASPGPTVPAVQGVVQPAASASLWPQTHRLPWGQQPGWFGQEDGHTLGAKVYPSGTNPLHHHTKGGGSHLPKAASQLSPASWHHVHVPAFKQPGWHWLAHVTPWLVGTDGPATRGSPKPLRLDGLGCAHRPSLMPELALAAPTIRG